MLSKSRKYWLRKACKKSKKAIDKSSIYFVNYNRSKVKISNILENTIKYFQAFLFITKKDVCYGNTKVKL